MPRLNLALKRAPDRLLVIRASLQLRYPLHQLSEHHLAARTADGNGSRAVRHQQGRGGRKRKQKEEDASHRCGRGRARVCTLDCAASLLHRQSRRVITCLDAAEARRGPRELQTEGRPRLSPESAQGRPVLLTSDASLGVMLLVSAPTLLAAVSCPDTRALPLPSSALTDSCVGGSIFSTADLNGASDVLAIYNGDQT